MAVSITIIWLPGALPMYAREPLGVNTTPPTLAESVMLSDSTKLSVSIFPIFFGWAHWETT